MSAVLGFTSARSGGVGMSKPSIERRRYKRHPICCPVTIHDEHRSDPLKSQAVNVSDGGLLLAVEPTYVPPMDHQIEIKLMVPRSTANTHMLEEFQLKARVARHEMLASNDLVGVALQFQPATDLGLEV
jgi:c-di-GMP-binding flagellar brake protein YcgR